MRKIVSIIICCIFLCESAVYPEDTLRVPISQRTMEERTSEVFSWHNPSKVIDKKISLPTITKEQIPRILGRMQIHNALREKYIKIFEEFIDIVAKLKKAGINYAFNDELKIISLYAQAELDNIDGEIIREKIDEILYTNSSTTLFNLRKKIEGKRIIPFFGHRRGYLGIKFPEIEEKDFYELSNLIKIRDNEEIIALFISHIRLMKKIGIDRGRTIYEDVMSTFIKLAQEKKRKINWKKVEEELKDDVKTDVRTVLSRLRLKLKEGYIDPFSATKEEDREFSRAFLETKRGFKTALAKVIIEMADEDFIIDGRNNKLFRKKRNVKSRLTPVENPDKDKLIGKNYIDKITLKKNKPKTEKKKHAPETITALKNTRAYPDIRSFLKAFEDGDMDLLFKYIKPTVLDRLGAYIEQKKLLGVIFDYDPDADRDIRVVREGTISTLAKAVGVEEPIIKIAFKMLNLQLKNEGSNPFILPREYLFDIVSDGISSVLESSRENLQFP